MRGIATRAMWIRQNNIEANLDRKLDRVTVKTLRTSMGEVLQAQQVAAKKGKTWGFLNGRLVVAQ